MDYKETIEPYYICWNNHGHEELRRIYSDDDTGTIFLEVITPACMNYSPFESTCMPECIWCDNPYHCKFNKNVPRETFMTARELPLLILSLDICWKCFNCNNGRCTHGISADMTALSITMILRGDY